MLKQNKKSPSWRGHYAGFASRLIALILDLLLLYAALAIFNSLIQALLNSLPSLAQSVFGITLRSHPTVNLLTTFLTMFVLQAFYFIFLWSTIGTTIGGLVIGVRMVNSDYNNPTVFQSLIRFLIEIFIPVFGLIGSIWILFDDRRQALFDKLAGTYVIYNWDARPDETFLKDYTEKLSSRNK